MSEPATGEFADVDHGVGLLLISVVAALGGLVVGFVGGGFRWCLLRAEDARFSVLRWAHDLGGPGWLVPVVGVALAATIARLIVRRVPAAAGSGIQDVEAVWRGDADPPSLSVLPAKFVGGLVGIGSGLALGREGPTVHMGATVGAETGRRLKMSDAEVRLLQTAFGGAGLAVAFNAPLGGALFVFEEVTRVFRPRLILATLISCASSIAVMRIILADAPEFTVGEIATPPGAHLLVYVVFGLLVGCLGALYNRLVLGGLRFAERWRRIGAETQAAIIGALVGLLLFVDPFLSGDGAPLIQRVLDGDLALVTLIGLFAARLAIGPISYAAGTPGGLFAPLLTVGALAGLLFHELLGSVPGATDPGAAYAIVGMAAFFAAVVRAPFTGIVLVLELTANTTLIAPLFAASVAAVIAADFLRSEPIYDSLWERVLLRRGAIRSGPRPDDDGDPGDDGAGAGGARDPGGPGVAPVVGGIGGPAPSADGSRPSDPASHVSDADGSDGDGSDVDGSDVDESDGGDGPEPIGESI